MNGFLRLEANRALKYANVKYAIFNARVDCSGMITAIHLYRISISSIEKSGWSKESGINIFLYAKI